MIPSSLTSYNGHNGHLPHDADDIDFTDVTPAPRTPATYTLWKQEQHTPGWQDREPPYLHSLKYHLDGIEHLTVIRANDGDSLWLEVRKVMALVKAARAKGEEHAVAVTTTLPGVAEPPTPPAPPDEPQKGFCTVHTLWMTLHHAKDGSGGQWFSHRGQDASGQWGWCRGGK